MIPAIKRRRSVREYLAEKATDEKIQEIIKAAMYAPSANAKYPWELIVVTDPIMKEKLSKATPWSLHAQGAAAVIVVIGHEQESSNWIEDCSIVAEHIWLEATEQELSSCWIQIRGNDTAEKDVKSMLGIPPELRVLCLMPLGSPATTIEEHNEDDIVKSRVKYERY